VLRIGVVQTMFRNTPETVVQIALKPFKNLLESSTGLSGEIVPGGQPLALARKLQDDQLQLAVFHGFEFAWARQKYPELKAISIAVNKQPHLHAVLVVHQNCKATSYTGLQGKVVAMPMQNKEHCRIYFERRCVKPGVKPTKFFQEITDPNDAFDALDDVVDRVAEATVVDSVAFDSYCSTKPARGRQLRILSQSEAFPCGVIACNPKRFDNESLSKIQSALLSAKESKAGLKLFEMIRITGFESVPANFEAHLNETARLYPHSDEVR